MLQSLHHVQPVVVSSNPRLFMEQNNRIIRLLNFEFFGSSFTPGCNISFCYWISVSIRKWSIWL